VRIDDPFGSPFYDATQLYPGIACEDSECPPVTDGQTLTVSGGSSLSSIDFTVHPSVVVKGRVTDAVNGQGVGGVRVQFSSSGTAAISAAGSGEYVLYVGEGGSFRVYAVGAPPHINQVFPNIDCLVFQCSGTGQPFSAVRGSVFEHVDFALQPGATIAGTIYDANSGLPRYGNVVVYDSDFNLVWTPSGTDESGSYMSATWYPGTYYVKATTGLGSSACAFYDARPCPAENQDPATVMPTPLLVGPGEIRDGIDFHLDADTVFRNGFDSQSPLMPAARAARTP
jgi:hypothetical protein